MIKPHVLKNLKEINTLKLRREALEKEAAELWKERDWKKQGKISVLHGKMNTTQHRITYLFNLRGVKQALFVTDIDEAHEIIHEGRDICWDYNRAINGEKGCSLCRGVCKAGRVL